MRRETLLFNTFSIIVAAPLLLWPAILNGYPLLFGDTGVYITDGIAHHVSWARPMFYGLFMLPLHWKLMTWPVVVAQSVITTSVMLLTMRSFIPKLNAVALLPMTLILSIGTSLPWFVSQLMPDMFAGLMVLVLSVLMMVPMRLGRPWKVGAVLFAAVCITFHLSLLPIALALIVVLMGCRVWVERRFDRGSLVRGLLVPLLAVVVLVGTNAALTGRASVSPYGKIFYLNRILVDGPGERVLQRECPREGWTLCAFKDEIPTITDEDDILWGPKSVLARAGGYRVVGDQAGPIIQAALRAEPMTLLKHALRNSANQFVSFRSGDALLRPSRYNDKVWKDVFPADEQRRYHEGRQYQRLELIPRWLEVLHVLVASGAVVAVGAGAVRALRDRSPLGGLFAATTIVLVVNAVVAGGLSGVYDRYQSRFVWLAPFAVMLMMTDWLMRRADAVRRAQ